MNERMKLRKLASYEEYVQLQSETNKKKLTHIWASEPELRKLARYVKKHIGGAKFGICHGVRNGYEVEKLRALLPFEIIGTEISDTATQFPHVIQWDFHEVKDEWIGNTDFIYSNSWDHSYDPELMLERWMSCLSPDGRCFLEWSRNHMPKSVYGADWFGIEYDEFVSLLKRRYEIEAVLSVPAVPLSRVLQQPLRCLKSHLSPRKLIVVRPRSSSSSK